MKKIWIGVAACAMAAATASVGNIVTADAATTIADNYGAYVVATGDSANSNGWTTYYTKIGGGNGIMTFDLLSVNTFGYFGLICGQDTDIKDFDVAKDYVLVGKDIKTTLDLETTNFAFEAGYTYKATFNASGKKLSLEKKAIGASDEDFVSVFEADTTFASSNVIGMAALSDGYDSAAVIIDNLKVSDLKGKTYYVNNSFDGGAKVTDGAMKVGLYDTATDATGSIGSVYIHKDAMATVRFVDESGELIAMQNVCWYGSATAPNAPKKEGYDFVGWSKDLHGITENMLVYPIYAVSKPDDPTTDKPTDKPSTDSSSGTTSEDGGDAPDGQGIVPSLLGCFGSVGVGSMAAVLTMAGAALTLKKRGDK